MRPLVVATPAPGAYEALLLDVSIGSGQEGLVYYVGINEEPDMLNGFHGELNVRLNRSSKILVKVEDAAGEIWGPYAFEYTLFRSVPEGICSITPPSRYYFRPTESFVVEVRYAFAAALSTLHLSLDGVSEIVGSPATLEPGGTLELTVGPIQEEGTHSVECFVSDSKDVPGKSGAFELVIDGTPPDAVWRSAGGKFTRADWPGEFNIEAADALSGISAVVLCKSGFTPCFELPPDGSGLYTYATVLTGETSIQTSITGYITDWAGNQTILPPLEFDTLGFGEPPPSPPPPVTLVTGAVIDLYAVLQDEGRNVTVAEARSLDLQTAYDVSALPLLPGWNDFLYRQAGRGEWESFGIYRAGITLRYPPSAAPWLVFASQSTTPGMQGDLSAWLPAGGGGTWARPWFDVPHVWFVKDLNTNSKWDDSDELWVVESDPFLGPHQKRLAPVDESLSLRSGTVAATFSTAAVVCEVCTSPGVLFFERRLSPYGYPESHSAFPSVTFSAFETDATVPVWADATDWCGFFWDENVDGVVNGSEPRAFHRCTNSTFSLARKGPLAAKFADGVMRLSGIPYGGSATGVLQVRDGGEILYRESVIRLSDKNGTGHVTAAIERPIDLPYTFALHRGDASIAIDLPGPAPTQWTNLRVVDETGAAISAVAAVRRGDAVFGQVFHAGGGYVAVGIPPPQGAEPLQAFALREGYLSLAVPVTSASMTVRILHPAVTGQVIGTVKDLYGYPISNATLTWQAQGYRAKTFSDASGWYALPASGSTGTLRVSAPGPYRRETFFWMDVSRETVLHEVVLQDETGPAWPVGANIGVWPEALAGAYRATPYVSDLYYSARVSSGTWEVRSSYGPARTVSMPGALPPLSADSASRMFPPGDLALSFVEQYARCGARLQLIVSFVGAMVDSDCWGWYAKDAYQEYVLGRIDMAEGFPPIRGLGMMNATVQGTGGSIELLDVLLGRKIRVPIEAGGIRAPVPVGLYAVRKFGGGAAIPSHIAIYATENPNVTLTLP